MKKLLLVTFFGLVGCVQLMHGQEQPVIQKSIKDSIYFTTCAGAAEGWSDCYSKARRTCPNGYVEISSYDNHIGTKRDYTFQCKR